MIIKYKKKKKLERKAKQRRTCQMMVNYEKKDHGKTESTVMRQD